MKKLKISMSGADSGFVLSVAKELVIYDLFDSCEFVLMDSDKERLQAANKAGIDIKGANLW